MTTRTAKVANAHGIHCRPSALLIKELSGYGGQVFLSCGDGRRARADSILAVVGLALRCGESVTVEVSGPDEDTVAARLVDLLETQFDFAR